MLNDLQGVNNNKNYLLQANAKRTAKLTESEGLKSASKGQVSLVNIIWLWDKKLKLAIEIREE